MNRIEQIKERWAKATDLPWRTELCNNGEKCWCRLVVTAGYSDRKTGDNWKDTCIVPDGSIGRDDAELIANAPADIAYLLKQNAALQSQMDHQQEILRQLAGEEAHWLDTGGQDKWEKKYAALMGMLAKQRQEYEQYVRSSCKMIRHCVADGVPLPDDVDGKCGGYTQNPWDDEPHDNCKYCVAAYGNDEEIAALLDEGVNP